MEPSPLLGLGYSTCPNDTFMFHALVHGRIADCAARFEVYMDDIEALNQRALGQAALPRLSFSKVSTGALPWLTEEYTVMRTGAALGRGCGPLVVARQDGAATELAALSGKRLAIPGERTTATLLMRIFAPHDVETVTMRFERIMPAVAEGEVDAGLIIHESRFTYPDYRLCAVADLGELWEADTGLPLPLGVIAARRQLGEQTISDVERALGQSVRYAFDHPAESRDYVRQHAQELSEDVCERHIALYVNDFSADMGDEGKAAIQELLSRGARVGALPRDMPSPFR